MGSRHHTFPYLSFVWKCHYLTFIFLKAIFRGYRIPGWEHLLTPRILKLFWHGPSPFGMRRQLFLSSIFHEYKCLSPSFLLFSDFRSLRMCRGVVFFPTPCHVYSGVKGFLHLWVVGCEKNLENFQPFFLNFFCSVLSILFLRVYDYTSIR